MKKKTAPAPSGTTSNSSSPLLLTPPSGFRGPQRQIFANRDLRLDKIKALGFDMDFTLALYKNQGFQELTHTETLKRLVDKEKYPEEILKLKYNPQSVIRGLVMDKKLGTLFKLDSHYYVGRVMRQNSFLDKDERKELYGNRKIPLSSDDYHWLDTLFEIPEADLYSQLTTFFANHPNKKQYPTDRIFEEVRRCMDASHADPEVKGQITRDLDRYVERDPLLPIALHRFRSVGKQLFLLTNSSWEYTNKVMDYLLPKGNMGYQSWMHYFEAIVVSSRKPVFFSNGNAFEKPEITGDIPAIQALKIWKGGNINALQKILRAGGEEILYVGDHIYGDILRSKKDCLWRTCMVIPELEREIALTLDNPELFQQFWMLEDKRKHLDEEINFYRMVKWNLSSENSNGSSLKDNPNRSKEHISELQKKLQDCLYQMAGIQREVDRISNPIWGLLMREDNEKSLFGAQVEDYAGLYTGRVSNFCFYSPLQYFRASPDMMPHEMVI